MGGFSNSANRVPSKSVEMSFMGEDMGTCCVVRIAYYVLRVSTTNQSLQLSARNTGGRFLRLRASWDTVTQTKTIMPSLQEQYDDAMFDFSRADYDAAIVKLKALLA